MRVAFLGPAGTFAEEALRSSAPAGVEVEELPYPTVYETVMAVQAGDADRAGRRRAQRLLGERARGPEVPDPHWIA